MVQIPRINPHRPRNNSLPNSSSCATIVIVPLIMVLCAQSLFSQQLPAYRSAAKRGVPSTFPAVPIQPRPSLGPSADVLPVPPPEESWTGAPYSVTGMTYVVSTTANSGPGSLRQAILDADANPGTDLITFAIPGSGVQTISLTSPLPIIDDPVVIDGATMTGYSGKPLLELNGSGAGSGVNGLVITGGDCIVRALVINRFVSNGANGMGIVLDGFGRNTIEGCYIGLDAAGKVALGNGGSGIAIFNTSGHNTIGGNTAAKRNVISGNGMSGIQVSTGAVGGNRIINNYIGLDATADTIRGNSGNGIFIDAPDDTIGGTDPALRNVISGNGYPGLALSSAAERTIVQGNYFGTGWDPWYGFGNSDNGILILGGSNNIIGGRTKAARNEIYDSDQAGILIEGSTAKGNIVQGNYIGAVSSNYGQTSNAIGIWVRNAPGNTIGGAVDSAGNLVTQNRMHGIEISGSTAMGNIVQGNRIGGSTRTLSGYGNKRYGLVIDGAPGNIIGGTASYAPNFIQGNGGGGIIIAGANAKYNVVQGNFIGPDINRMKGNGVQPDGIILAAPKNLIGGTNPYEGNIIAYNKRCGIYDSTGSGNAFLSNLIYSNDSLEIDLGPRGITMNDPLDADAGANDLQNYPILDSADIGAGSVRIRGRMFGSPGATYMLEFFSYDKPDPFHFGQAQYFLGEGSVTCDVDGLGDINTTIAASMRIDQYITATATNADSSTSEFSRELCMLDSDGDGILDIWETEGNGIDWNCDGVIDLNLNAKGASKDHKDIFVEVDFMAGRRPDPQSLQNVMRAFRAVPNRHLGNPGGMNGVDLFAELDSLSAPIAHALWAADPWPEFLAAKAAHFGTDVERADANWVNIREAKYLVYRYCIFADKFGSEGYTGMTRLTATNWEATNDFFVALGDMVNIPNKRVMFESSTFMHELGHALALKHGGTDHELFKPNYYSIMNYLFLWDLQDPPAGRVVPKHTWKLDYSPAALSTLNENNLHEFLGFDPASEDFDVVEIPYNRKGSYQLALLKQGTSVDWDGNGDSSSYSLESLDLNYFPPRNTPSPGGTMTSYADWPNLSYDFRKNPMSQIRMMVASALPKKDGLEGTDSADTEATYEDFLELKKLPPFGIIERKGAWSRSSLENIPIGTKLRRNSYPQIVPDGSRGAIIAWTHWENASVLYPDMSGIYVQHIDSLGQIHWMNNGVRVTLDKPVSISLRVAPDGSGGIIIAWSDLVDPLVTTGPKNLHAQRIDANGNRRWGETGTTIVSNSMIKGHRVTSDGGGGAVIAWGISSPTAVVYAQRIDANAVPQWKSGGIEIGPSSSSSSSPSQILHDSATGTVIVWYVPSGSTGTVRAQRISLDGSVRWGRNGIVVSSAGMVPSMVLTEDKNIIIAWENYASWTKILAQRLDTAGTLLWTATGLTVDASSTTKYFSRLVSDGRGGAIAAWFEDRTSPNRTGISTQRISSSGTLLWPPSSMSFVDSTGGSDFALDGDGAGGAILNYVWRDPSSARDIYSQRIDSSGSLLWDGRGTPVSTAINDQMFPVATGDGVGGTIVAWQDERRGTQNSDTGAVCVYAQLVNRNGGLGGTLVSVPREGPAFMPESFRLFQNYPNPFNPSTTLEYELTTQSKVVLRVYDVLGRVVQELKNDIEPAGRMRVVWNPHSRLASGIYLCRIEVKAHSGASSPQTRVVKMLLIK